MISSYKKVWIANGKLDAEMIRSLLESCDIPTLIFQESIGATYGMAFGQIGEAEIFVPKEKVKEAKEILDAYVNGNL